MVGAIRKDYHENPWLNSTKMSMKIWKINYAHIMFDKIPQRGLMLKNQKLSKAWG